MIVEENWMKREKRYRSSYERSRDRALLQRKCRRNLMESMQHQLQEVNCCEVRASSSHHTRKQLTSFVKKQLRIASVEQVELGNITELSITGHVLKWARQSNLSGGLSAAQSGWMELEDSQPFDIC